MDEVATETVVNQDGQNAIGDSVELTQDQAQVKLWLSRIVAAKAKWEEDFKRMRACMEFVAGLQWAGQVKMDDERYSVNITLRTITEKVATLYAKNPTAIATRRPRLDYVMWDGELESLMESIRQSSQIAQSGAPVPVEHLALMADFQQGTARRKLVERVGQTLQIIYQYQVDSHNPSFKEQLKQVVRRVSICGVGYGRPIFCRDGDETYKEVSTVDTGTTVQDRIGRIRVIANKIQDGEVDESSAQLSTLRSLVMSVGASQAMMDEDQLPERLEFDFAPATTIIPDTRCRNLKDFVGARWIAQQFDLPVDDVNAIFGTEIKTGSNSSNNKAKEFTRNGDDINSKESLQTDPQNRGIVHLYEVFDKDTKTRFFVCEGYKDYVLHPEPPVPSIPGFWHHVALTFNDIEPDPDSKATIFPPSDVQTMKHVQKEWNRTRNALRDQRNANAPQYVVRKGLLTDKDKETLQNAVPNQVVELEGIPPDMEPAKFISVLPKAPVDPALYDTDPLAQDMMLGAGVQQANIGPAQPNVTATVGSIAEQSRLNVTGSNVDDLDGFLSKLAEIGGVMLLKSMSVEVAKRIAGPGAAWPSQPQTRQDFLNEVFLKIEAASSGRPNKAIDIANRRDLTPLLIQAGANPVGIIEDVAKIMDDNIDVSKYFPIMPPGLMDQSPLQPQSSPEGAPPNGAAPTGAESPMNSGLVTHPPSVPLAATG